MIAVIQRVGETTLSVDGEIVSSISRGLVVFLGIRSGDSEQQAEKMAAKISGLRIFRDENDKMNFSVKDIDGEVLLVSQFTLCGDCTHGNRPDFMSAERPERANSLYRICADKMRLNGLSVKTGVFGADMKISQFNDGPVTIIYEV